MKKHLAVAGALSLTLALAACGDDDGEDTTADSTMTTEETTGAEETEGAAEDTEPNIVETAEAAGDFSTLVTALQAAGLDEELSQGGPYTVFAPTDEAFEALPVGALDDLLADPTGELTDILSYHVIEGEVMAEDVMDMDGDTVTTLQGEDLTIEVEDDTVYLVDANNERVQVIDTDVEASNGLIHAIDGVLMPADNGDGAADENGDDMGDDMGDDTNDEMGGGDE